MAVPSQLCRYGICLCGGRVCLRRALSRPGWPGCRVVVAPASLVIEHPCGVIAVILDYTAVDGQLTLHNAGLLRTARKLFAGSVYIPAGIWD